jgi:HEPN domain-containing protein
MDNRDDWTWPSRPTNETEFDAMMTSLDRHLGSCGLLPFQRGLNAVRLVSMRLALSGHNLLPRPEQRGALFSPTDLLGRVHDWYDANYGDRMHMNMSPGAVALQMHGTLWLLELPRIWGTVKMFIDRDLTTKGLLIGAKGRTASHNVLLSVRGMTQAYASRLEDDDLRLIGDAFERGWHGLNFLDGLEEHDLFAQARDDRKLAVVALLDGSPSKARWDTAQCAEKVFKGLLARAGHDYPTDGRRGHDIVHMGSLLEEKLGMRLSADDLAVIHCSAAVRYVEKSVSQEEALAAHDALLRVLNTLSGTGNQPA